MIVYYKLDTLGDKYDGKLYLRQKHNYVKIQELVQMLCLK